MADEKDIKVATHHENLAIDLLELDDKNVNEETDDEFAGVVSSIREFGFLDPIWVYPFGEGKYKIISGNHRTQAARYLGLKEIPAIVFEITDTDVAQVIAIRANYARGKLSPAKFTKIYNELRQKYGGTALRAMMGIQDEKKWKNLYKDVRSGLPPVVNRPLFKCGKCKEMVSVDMLVAHGLECQPLGVKCGIQVLREDKRGMRACDELVMPEKFLVHIREKHPELGV